METVIINMNILKCNTITYDQIIVVSENNYNKLDRTFDYSGFYNDLGDILSLDVMSELNKNLDVSLKIIIDDNLVDAEVL